MYRKGFLVISMVIGLMLVLSACSPAASEGSEPQEMESAEVQPDAAVEEAEAAEIVPSLTVDDQSVEDASVIVREVLSAGPGWMVIHASADGKPGPILGLSPVQAGQNGDVRVDIDVARATDRLFAMLHVDQGQVGTFEFPDGDDKPAFVGDVMVNVPFAVELPMAQAEDGTLNFLQSELGKVLVDRNGMALYLFVPDGQGESTCYDACATNWPPLVADGEVSLGEGLEAELVGTITRQDGSLQVTYNKWPLYYFVRDAAPGDLLGQGVNDVWYLLGAAGDAVVEAVSSEYKQ